MFVVSMIVFGTIGIVRSLIPINSVMLAFLRGFLGATFILICCFVLKLRGKSPFKKIHKKDLFIMIVSGTIIGANWLALFEAYKYTSVPVATLCYDMVSVFVVIAAFIVLKEVPSRKSILCLITALFGVVLVTGVIDNGSLSAGEIKGILLALFGALSYTIVILLNKKVTTVDSNVKTVIQLYSASIVLVPYLLISKQFSFEGINSSNVFFLIECVVINTGVVYMMYFRSIEHVTAKQISILSFIDPISALILSAVVLDQTLTPLGIVGAIIILGSIFFSEFKFKKKNISTKGNES